MGVFELEGTTLQGKDFRDHLNRNWTNGNQMLANLNSLYGTNAAGKATFAPSGVVSTATDLNTQYPDGEVGIFVTADTGHWYYWSGTAWVDGGNYQAAKISFKGLLKWIKGQNLLEGTSASFQLTSGWGSPSAFGSLTGYAGKYLRLKFITSSVTGGGVCASISLQDASGNYLNYDGSAYNNPNGQKGFINANLIGGATAFDTDASKEYNILLSIPANATTVSFGWGSNSASTSLEISSVQVTEGSGDYDYSQNIDELDTANAIDYISEKLKQDVSKVSLFGMNLIKNTNRPPILTSGWGSPSAFGSLTGYAGKYLRLKFITSSVTGGGVCASISLQDASGNYLNYDGSAYSNPNGQKGFINANLIGGATAFDTDASKEYNILLSIPANATTVSFGWGSNSASTSLEISSVQVTEGSGDYDYSQNIDDVDENEQLLAVTDSLNKKIDYSNENKLTLPKIVIYGNYTPLLLSNVKSVLPIKLIDKNRVLSCYAEMKWQGDSSLNWRKKSFKLKCYDSVEETNKVKFRPRPTFYSSHSFNLKAYFTDKYSIRDSVCAEILSRFIASNSTAPTALLQANHFGTIQSMPVLLYFDEQFYGLMELNTKSGSDLWNIDDDDPNQIAVESNGDGGTGGLWNTDTPTVSDDGDFDLQSDNDANAQAAVQALAAFIHSSSDADFATNFSQYLDINSVADFVIFNFLVNNIDCWNNKNQNYITYDAKKWYMMPYDFDATFSNSWDPTSTSAVSDSSNFLTDKNNILLKRFYELMPDKLQARFNELESLGVLNIPDLQKIIDYKANEIGSGAYELEWSRWQNNQAYQSNVDVNHMKWLLLYRKNMLKIQLESMQGSAS